VFDIRDFFGSLDHDRLLEFCIRERIRARTGRNRTGVRDIRVVIDEPSPILRGWGGFFRTGNAARKFNQVDRYVVRRLRSLLVKKRGRNLAPTPGRAVES
jgi:hypothetical protein